MKLALFVFCIFFFSNVNAISSMRWLDLDWEDIQQAQGYEIEVIKDKGLNSEALLYQEKSIESRWSKQVNPGKYYFRLRGMDSRGVPGEWSDYSLIDVRYPRPIYIFPLANDNLKGVEVEQEKINFEWKPIDGASLYYFEVWNDEGFEFAKITKDSQHSTWLNVAKKYQWRVVAIDSEQDEIGPREGDGVTFFLNGGGLNPPELKILSSEASKLMVEWNAVELASSYEILIYKKGLNNRWGVFKRIGDYKENILNLTNYELGEYRLAVKSLAFGRTDSALAYLEFNIEKSGEVSVGISKIQTGSEIKDDTPFFYGYGVEFMSLSYDGKSREKDTGISTVLSGQRFFLESSYQDFFSRWKHRLSLYYQNLKNLDNSIGLMELDYLVGQNFKYKKIITELSFGLFYKEDLFIIADVFTDTLSFEKVSNMGPVFRVFPHYTLNRYFDLSLEAKLYVHAFALSTPNEEDLLKTISGSAQFSLNYKKDDFKSYTVFAGLYFSNIDYKTTAGDSSNSSSTSVARDGAINEANSTGKSVGVRFNTLF